MGEIIEQSEQVSESILILGSVKEDQNIQETGECADEENNLQDPPLVNDSKMVNSDNLHVPVNNKYTSGTEYKTKWKRQYTKYV